MASLKVSLYVGRKKILDNQKITLQKSVKSGNAYDLFHTIHLMYGKVYKFDNIKIQKTLHDIRYPNARPGTMYSTLRANPRSTDFLTKKDVDELNEEINDPYHTLRFKIIIPEQAGEEPFVFHSCWFCNAEAELVDKIRMEAFCSGACHEAHLAALPSVTLPPEDEDFWEGPYEVWVPRTINDVPARDGRNRQYQTGGATKMKVYPPLTESEWKAKYAYEKNGRWYYRV